MIRERTFVGHLPTWRIAILNSERKVKLLVSDNFLVWEVVRRGTVVARRLKGGSKAPTLGPSQV